MKQQIVIHLTLVIAFIAFAAQAQDSFVHKPKNETEATRSDHNPLKRAGRMLDLDQLAGDIGKEEKIARERQQSGDRQSRILSDDLFLTGEVNKQKSARSSSKKTKKIAISGFIPIVSLDKHSDNSADVEEEQEDQQQQQQQRQQQLVNNLLASYGGQTSLGHASFDQQPLESQTELADRASRKLLGNPVDMLSQLTGQQHYLKLQAGAKHPPAPMAPGSWPHASSQVAPMSMPDSCICVPFYQCKHGYLSDSQLSKSQFAAGQLQLQSQLQLQQLPGHQTPRALPLPLPSQQQDLYNYNHNQHMAQISAVNNAQQQQPFSDELIYEQLKKTIESENLEQQAAYQPLDERSQNGAKQQNQTEGDVQGRNILLSPLSALTRAHQHQYQQQKPSCGIMRTCCRLPPHLSHQNHLSQRQIRQPAQISQPLRSQPSTAQTTLLYPYDQQSQPTTLVGRPKAQQPQYPPMPSQTPSPGAFMSGRCGLRPALGISGRVQNSNPSPGSETSAEFGEFPAHVAILKRLSNQQQDSLFVCSASLISNQWLATAAHCVRRLQPSDLKVRLGEWDVNRDDEFYPYVEANVREIVIHPDFQPSSLINDLALLRLDAVMDGHQMPHIAPACLAQTHEQFQGQRCWLAGWGKDAFGSAGSFQSVLRKVDLPVVGRHECEQALRFHTRLGKHFRLHSSAICAGGERGKDACEGDGGSGLYCQDPTTGLTKLAGLVSWGVGCGQVGVPGVYTNLSPFQAWVEQVVASSGEESLYMDRNGPVNSLESIQGSSSPQGGFRSIISERNMLGNHTVDEPLQGKTNNETILSATTTLAPQAVLDDEGLESRAG